MHPLQAKIDLLNNARAELKVNSVGLEDIIDRIIDIISIVFLKPEFVKHPIVIPTFGFSAVGKTTLIRKVIAALSVEHSFAEIDARNLSGYTLINTLEEKLGAERINDSSGQPLFVMLDEFHNISKSNSNYDDCYDLWSFLRDGIVPNDRGSKVKHVRYILSAMLQEDVDVSTLDVEANSKIKEEKVRYQIQKSIREFVVANRFKIEAGPSDFISAEEEAELDIDDMLDSLESKTGFADSDSTEDFNLSKASFSQMLYAMIQHFCDNRAALSYVAFMASTPESLIAFMDLNVDKQKINSVYDFSKSVVFLCGNFYSFDYAKYGSSSMYDADQIRDITLSFTDTELKEILSQNFSPEQINRFGSNFILFPSVSKASFESFIRSNLEQFCSNLKAEYNFSLGIEPNVYSYIYGRGVQPLEGYGPLKSEVATFISKSFVLVSQALIEEANGGIIVFDSNHKVLALNFLKGKQPFRIISRPDASFDNEKIDPEILVFNCIDLAAKILVYASEFQSTPGQIVVSVNKNNPNVFLYYTPTDSTRNRLSLIKLTLAARALAFEIYGDQAPLIYGHDIKNASLMMQNLVMNQRLQLKEIEGYVLDFNVEFKYLEDELAKFFKDFRKESLELVEILHGFRGSVELEQIEFFLLSKGFDFTQVDNFKVINNPYSQKLSELTGNVTFAMPFKQNSSLI